MNTTIQEYRRSSDTRRGRPCDCQYAVVEILLARGNGWSRPAAAVGAGDRARASSVPSAGRSRKREVVEALVDEVPVALKERDIIGAGASRIVVGRGRRRSAGYRRAAGDRGHGLSRS